MPEHNISSGFTLLPCDIAVITGYHISDPCLTGTDPCRTGTDPCLTGTDPCAGDMCSSDCGMPDGNSFILQYQVRTDCSTTCWVPVMVNGENVILSPANNPFRMDGSVYAPGTYRFVPNVLSDTAAVGLSYTSYLRCPG